MSSVSPETARREQRGGIFMPLIEGLEITWNCSECCCQGATATITKARRRVLGTRSDSPSNYCQFALGQRERLSALFGPSALVAANAAVLLLAIQWPIMMGVHVAQESRKRDPHSWNLLIFALQAYFLLCICGSVMLPLADRCVKSSWCSAPGRNQG